MRVIAGTCRSMPLCTPRGEHTRPTTDRIKETLFNILQTEVPGSVFLDVFAGSGGIAIEALSRGAKHAYLIDNDKEACECITKNLNFTKLADDATLLKGDFASGIASIREICDIVFMDPPFDSGLDVSALRILKNSKAINEDSLIIIEAGKDRPIEELEACGFTVNRVKNYKTNKHIFLSLED